MERESFNTIGVYLGDGARFSCAVYRDSKPILSVDAGECSLLLASRRGKEPVEEFDVANARRLVVAATKYLAELERMYSAQHDGEATEQAAYLARALLRVEPAT